jgi:Ca-activated chloride channel family protein
LCFSGIELKLKHNEKQQTQEQPNNRKEQPMKQHRLKSFIFIICLIAATGAAMAYSDSFKKAWFSEWITSPSNSSPMNPGPVTLSGRLVQNKILQGSDGRVNLALTLKAADGFDSNAAASRNVDMVIVLDRSGSMKGRKIADARQAVASLLSSLSAEDRFALITYSDSVQFVSNLNNVTAANREQLQAIVRGVTAGGGTNLGAGLRAGIKVLLSAHTNGNARKVILISDGLANKGITNPTTLGNMAGVAVEKEFAVSTVGVGNDFNEQLMTRIADRGAGNYYYLENPMAFAEVFQKEFLYTQATVATGVSIHVPLREGISLVNAAGYPITIQENHAVFYPGDLRSGQTRKLFLTVQVPSGTQRTFEVGTIKARYRFNGQPLEAILDDSFEIACVKNQKEVHSSIDKASWTDKVIREDYNRLKQEVAGDMKAGKKDKALRRIESYYREQESINQTVDSAAVTKNLDRDVRELKELVTDTFQGAPAAVMQKQKSNSKALQYEGYRGRR